MYRPQFVRKPAVPPCQDQACMYSFDKTNLPVFLGILAAGAEIRHIPLRMDKDADFYLRAIRSQGTVSIRLEDGDGNALSDKDNAVNGTNYELPDEFSYTAGTGLVAFESGAGGVFCRAGGNFILYLYNAGATPIELSTCALNLAGVKRYSEEVCRQ
jgi:hypothetical protein